jgi:hypothetical protein
MPGPDGSEDVVLAQEGVGLLVSAEASIGFPVQLFRACCLGAVDAAPSRFGITGRGFGFDFFFRDESSPLQPGMMSPSRFAASMDD